MVQRVIIMTKLESPWIHVQHDTMKSSSPSEVLIKKFIMSGKTETSSDVVRHAKVDSASVQTY